MKTSTFTLVSAALLGGILSSVITIFAWQHFSEKSSEERIKDFYATETAVMVSPHHIRKAMTKGESNFVLVDVRSQEEYEEEHIIGAINIPAYKDKDNSDYGSVERIVSEFRALEKNRDIIVYCYSIPCMTGRKVGKILADHDIYVKELGVGWNEWRYYWNLWNHQHEWNETNVLDYVSTGKEPGAFQFTGEEILEPCSIEGDLGC